MTPVLLGVFPTITPNQIAIAAFAGAIAAVAAFVAHAPVVAAVFATVALQAAIAACHARARKAEDTDWQRIASYYGELAQVMPSPVVELNRAVAIGMADGPAAGLVLVDALVAEQSLKNYHLLPSVRGDLLSKLGRHDDARKEFERAAAMTRNERERKLLLERAGVKNA